MKNAVHTKHQTGTPRRFDRAYTAHAQRPDVAADAVAIAPAAAEPTPEELAAASAALAAGEPCPLCAKYTDPVTGELHLNAETIAAIEEGRAMMRGEIPSPTFHSFEEFLADLRS